MTKQSYVIAVLLVIIALLAIKKFYGPLRIGISKHYIQQEAAGTPIKRDYQIEPFDKLTLRVPAHITIQQADHEALSITAPAEIINHITATIKNQKLIIKCTPKIDHVKDVTINLTSKNINKIKVNTTAKIDMPNFVAGTLKIKLNGAITLNLHLQAEKLSIESSGSSSIQLAGTVKEQEIKIKGSNDYQAMQLESKKTSIEVDGSASVEIYATEKLSIHADGSISIGYKGQPSIERDIKGAGNLYQISA